MVFALGFILGFLVAHLPQWVRRAPAAPPVNEEAQRRFEKAVREYRNFMTYDGFESREEE